nr:hypothetical protein [Tanacetum cinerariifolium]
MIKQSSGYDRTHLTYALAEHRGGKIRVDEDSSSTLISNPDHADVIKESGQQESGCTSHVHVADAHNIEADQVGGDRVVKKKKSGGNNGSTKNFTFSVKSKTQYHQKAKQSTDGMSISPKMTPSVGTNKASTSGHNKESSNNKGNIFSLNNLFEALNDKNLIIEEVATGYMDTTAGT